MINEMENRIAINTIAKEKRKKYISNASKLEKIQIFLFVKLVWYEPRDFKNPKFTNDSFGWFRCEKLNIYNPIMWLLFILSLLLMVFKSFSELFKEVIRLSKVARFG